MRRVSVILFLLLLQCVPFSLAAQRLDSAGRHDSAGSIQPTFPTATADEDFDLFLQVLLFVAFSLMIGIGAVGALLSLMLVAGLAALTAAGICSAALAVALYKKSMAAGFRTVVFLILPGAGICCGVALLWLVRVVFSQHYSVGFIVGAGTIFGAVGGWLAAWAGLRLFSVLLKRLFTRQ